MTNLNEEILIRVRQVQQYYMFYSMMQKKKPSRLGEEIFFKYFGIILMSVS